MTIYLITALINCSLGVAILALAALLVSLTILQLRKAAHLSLIDAIEIYTRWQQARIDTRNNQVLADLRQKQAALELHHRGRMLDVEATTAEMPIKRERLGLLATLDEVK